MSDTLTRGPEETTTPIDEAARLDKVVGGLEEAQAAEQATTLPQADQAPNLAAPAEMTVKDEADIAKLNGDQDVAPNPSEHVLDLTAKNKMDASAQLNQVYANEAAVANEKISQTAPGSPEEKAAYNAMKANIAPQVSAIQNEKLAETPDITEVKPEKKKRSLLHPST